MDEQAAKDFLLADVPGSTLTNTPAPTNLTQTAPLTSRVVEQARVAAAPILTSAIARADQEKQQFIQRNTQDGVPLDVDSGASGWERFVLGFRREQENQIAFLNKKYPDTVRLSDDGGLIVRVVDSKTQKPKDILVDERNMSAMDFIDLAGAVPEIAGGIIALRKGQTSKSLEGLKGGAGVARDILTTALGAETAGAAKDVAVGLIDKGSADLGQIAKDRTGMAVLDVAIGGISFPVAKFFSMMQNPLAGARKQVQFDAIGAQKYFKDKYGVDVPLSIGESTGSPLVSRTEAFMEKLPGGGTPFTALKDKQESALRKLQSTMMGQVPEPDEVVGQRLFDALKTKIAPLDEAVTGAKASLQKTGAAEIEGMVSGATMPERQLYKSVTGKEIRQAVVAKRDAVKAESDRLYSIVKEAPGGEGKMFSADGLQQDFAAILKKLPSPQSTATEASPILGPKGETLLRTETGEKLLREFVPPNVLTRLQSVAGLKDAKFSLSDLQQMRREVYDDIAKGEGVPGLGTHYLADIGKSLTKAIDDGIEALPTTKELPPLPSKKDKLVTIQRKDGSIYYAGQGAKSWGPNSPTIHREVEGSWSTGFLNEGEKIIGDAPAVDLKEALKAANEHYKKEVIPFNRTGITEMFRAADEAGGLADSQIVSRLFGGDRAIENFKLLRETLGNKSPDFVKAKRAIADNLLEKSRLPGEEIFDANSLITNLAEFQRKYREISDDVFGKDLSRMFRTAKAISAGGDDILSGKTISADDLKSLMADKTPTAAKLSDLVRAEQARTEAFKTRTLKDAAQGKIGQDFKASEFVNRFVETSDPKDVAKVLGLIKDRPALLEDVRAKTIERLFRDASRRATAGDISQLMSGDPTRIMSGTSLFKQIEDKTVRQKIETVLGPEIWQDLQEYIKLEAAGEAKEASFAAAGGLAAGMQIANLTRRGPLQYLTESTKNWVVANVLTRQPLRSWLTSVPSSEPGMASMLLSSPPFIEAVVEEFGEGTGAEAFIRQIKGSIDRWVTGQAARETQPVPPQDRQQGLENFLRGMGPLPK